MRGKERGGSYLPPPRGAAGPCRAGWAGRAWGGRRGRAGAGRAGRAAGAAAAAAAGRRAWCRPAGAGRRPGAGRGGRSLPVAAAASARPPAPAPLYRRRHGQAGAASPVQTKAPLMRRRQRPAGGGTRPRRALNPPRAPAPLLPPGTGRPAAPRVMQLPRRAWGTSGLGVSWGPPIHDSPHPGMGYPRV